MVSEVAWCNDAVNREVEKYGIGILTNIIQLSYAFVEALREAMAYPYPPHPHPHPQLPQFSFLKPPLVSSL